MSESPPAIIRAAPGVQLRSGTQLLSSAASAAWVAIAALVPIYRTLPPEIARFWGLALYALVGITVLFGAGALVRWWGVWIFACYSSLVAGITSSGQSSIVQTFPAGLQIALLFGLVPFGIAGAIARRQTLLREVTIAFVFGQTVSASVGIVQVFGLDVLGYSQANGRVSGLAGHPNVLAIMAAIAILVCAHTVATSRSRPTRVAVGGVLAVNVAALVSTGSLSGMYACLVGLLIVLHLRGVHLGRAVVVAAVTIATILAVLNSPVVPESLRDPLQRFYQVTGQTAEISTLGIRNQTYSAAWEWIAQDPLLGRGIDNANAASITLGTFVHNLPLRAWYQGGIVYGVAILLIYVAAAALLLRAIRTKSALSALPLGIIWAVLSFALTSALFEQVYYWMPVFFAWAALPRSGNAGGHTGLWARSRHDGPSATGATNTRADKHSSATRWSAP